MLVKKRFFQTGRGSQPSLSRSVLSRLWPVAFLALGASIAQASDSYSGTVDGVFTNEETSGFYLDANYNPIWISDSDPYITGDGTDDIVSGIAASDSAPDQWMFIGASFTDVAPGQTFLLGQLEYFNGTVDLGTGAFGGDLTLNFDISDGSAVDPLTLHYDHISTVNIGNQVHDADWLNFTAIDTSFHVYENDWATVDVYGRIVGDPYADSLTFQILPNADGSYNGFLGPNEPAVPAPAALVPFSVGAVAALKRRRR
jgi:hypothetical protein